MDRNVETYDFVPMRAMAISHADEVPVPDYLRRVYWWTYIHPFAVWFFDRLWLINLIVLTNYHRLREAALAEFTIRPGDRVLQVSCAYGDVTPKLAAKVRAGGGCLDVIDVLPIQLKNVRRKIPDASPVRYLNMDARDLKFSSGQYDSILLFLLLHETPMKVRLKALEEAFRVVKPEGKVVIVDFSMPRWWNPFRYLWAVFLTIFEPFALDMWRHDIRSMLPAGARNHDIERHSFFGGLFQKVIVRRTRNE
jgi:ubiquinone/menaquinone biosynthesis C-methylase UbiE